MRKQKEKKSKAARIDWKLVLVNAAMSFLIGVLLLILEKVIG